MAQIADRDERLSDNTHREPCKQCKDCKYWNDGTPAGNAYHKAHCQKYTGTVHKPIYVITNAGECEYRKT